MLKLILVNNKYKSKIEKFKTQMLSENSSFAGTGTLKTNAVDSWIQTSIDWHKGENLPNGYVPASQYLLINESHEIVGMAQLRHALTPYLRAYAGHIGYSIAPSFRGQGFCKIMLTLLLEECKKLHIKKVLVSCAPDNIPSKKCILACGGVFEETVFFEELNTFVEKYWIKV